MKPFEMNVTIDGEVIPVLIKGLEVDENTSLMNIEYDVDPKFSTPMVESAVGNFVLEALENTLNEGIAV